MILIRKLLSGGYSKLLERERGGCVFGICIGLLSFYCGYLGIRHSLYLGLVIHSMKSQNNQIFYEKPCTHANIDTPYMQTRAHIFLYVRPNLYWFLLLDYLINSFIFEGNCCFIRDKWYLSLEFGSDYLCFIDFNKILSKNLFYYYSKWTIIFLKRK